MKTKGIYQKTLGALLLATLTACGGDDVARGPNYNDPRYQGFATACGVSNNFMTAPYKQTVRGQDASGAVLDILIYGDGTGPVRAVGEIRIPDISRLGVGGTGSYRSCVAGEGQMEMNVTDPAIDIELQGGRIRIESGGPYEFPFIRGSVLKGNFTFQLNGTSPGYFWF